MPYGKRSNVDIVTSENLKRVSKVLEGKNIDCCDFTDVLKNVKARDLVFLDPPYTVTHENNGFIEYNKKLFSWTDQEKLCELIKELDKKGVYYIMTNAEHKEIRNLYHEVGEIRSLSRYSKVGGRNKTRGMFNEVIVSNILIK